MTRRGDRGFTLIEVLVSVVIGSMIVAGMIQAMFVGMRNLDDANRRLAGSNDNQLVAGNFTSDVASAETISTTGTKSHAAPGVSPTVTNTRLVSFWSFKNTSTITWPQGMSQAWNHLSTQFRIGMADEGTPAAGATGNRYATSDTGTSSITHSIALAPPLLGNNVVRRGFTPGISGTGGQLVSGKPATQQNDTMLAHVAVSGGSTTCVLAPQGWTIVSTRDSGNVLKSLIFRKVATNTEPANYTFMFRSPTDCRTEAPAISREAAVAIATYSGVATDSTGVNRSAVNVNPCGGETPILLLEWSDRHSNPADDVAIQVSYNETTVGTETHLVRSYCSAPVDSDMSGIPTKRQTLASNLAPAAMFASCASSRPLPVTSTTAATAPNYCALLPVTVTLSVTEPAGESEAAGRTYLLRATTRVDREEDL